MSTATTQQQYYTNTHRHHPSYPIRMDSSSPSNNNAPSTLGFANINNAQCRSCLSRFLEFRNQAINRMRLEYQKIWTGQVVPAVSEKNPYLKQCFLFYEKDFIPEFICFCSSRNFVIRTYCTIFYFNLFEFTRAKIRKQNKTSEKKQTKSNATTCNNLISCCFLLDNQQRDLLSVTPSFRCFLTVPGITTSKRNENSQPSLHTHTCAYAANKQKTFLVKPRALNLSLRISFFFRERYILNCLVCMEVC
jgi:hypothetical protein